MYLVCFLCASFLLDIDECSVNKGGCQHNCINTPGSFVCTCDDGYYLDANKKSCQGKDASVNLKVCQLGSHVLPIAAVCLKRESDSQCHFVWKEVWREVTVNSELLWFQMWMSVPLPVTVCINVKIPREDIIANVMQILRWILLIQRNAYVSILIQGHLSPVCAIHVKNVFFENYVYFDRS